MRVLLFLSFALLLADNDAASRYVGRRGLEAFVGAKLPDNAKLFYREDSWSGFLPDGHAVRGYAIDKDAEWISEKQCERNGFSKVKTTDVTIPVPEKYITVDNNLPVCYKRRVTNRKQNTEIVFIQGGQVIHYRQRT